MGLCSRLALLCAGHCPLASRSNDPSHHDDNEWNVGLPTRFALSASS
jgi:hypothetical protein